MPKTIALMPVYNESKTLEGVLERVWKHVDAVVCVNDASKDPSLQILRRFAQGKKGFYVVDLPHNRGMAGALKAGFQFVQHLVTKGVLSGEDVVVMLDADGQHEPEYIPLALEHMQDGGFGVVLMRRDFAKYPVYKILGNWFLSLFNSLLSGVRYHDVECGYRLMKAKVIPGILRYYTGFKYSCAQEIAFLTARQGLKVDNSFRINIPFYRYGATFWDGFIVLAFSLYTFGRWLVKYPVPQEDAAEFNEKCLRESRKAWS